MQTALIVMTILGCDDSVSQCHYIDTPKQQWVSVELCDAASENVLEGYSNVSYPMVIAVCQKPESAQADQAIAKTDPAPSTGAPVPEAAQKTLAARAMDTIRMALPGTTKIKMVFETPIHVIADSYAWVARKVTR